MYEVISISKGRLMAMRGAIAVLLLLVIVLYLKLTADPIILPGVVAFQKLLAEETSTGATIFDSEGKVTPFDRNLSLVKACGKSTDTTFPDSCLPKKGSDLLSKNVVTLMVYGNKEKVTDLIVGAGDPTYYRYTFCPGGQCCC